jgi:hypothetical protein
MPAGYVLVELFGNIADELNASYSVVLALVLIAAGLALVVMSRRAPAK